MNKVILYTVCLVACLLAGCWHLHAQNLWYDAARSALRAGTSALESGDTLAAQAAFDEARAARQGYAKAEYNAAWMLHQQGHFDSAQSVFGLSASLSPDSSFSSDAFYNQGNSLLAAQKFGPSIEAYKNALRHNPRNADARYNLAYAQQMMQQQQDQQKDKDNKDKPDPPSEYAKKLKAQADALVVQRKYQEAHELMQAGLKQDPTVENYQDYIGRLGEISGINPRN